MLPVFSVILEYRVDGRNSSYRPTAIGFVLHVHSALSSFQSKPKHIHLYSVEPYQLQVITEHVFRGAQTATWMTSLNFIFTGLPGQSPRLPNHARFKH